MALRTSALAVACIAIAAGSGPVAPGHAQTPDLFLFSACNETRAPAWISITNRVGPGSVIWRRHGWYEIAAGQCRYIGAFPRGYFYFYGIDGRGGVWAGTGLRTGCVNLRWAFDQAYSGAHTCLPGEMIVAINELFVEAPAYAVILEY